MRNRIPYYCCAGAMVLGAHFYAIGLRWPGVADALLFLLIVGLSATAVVEFAVYEQEKRVPTLYDGPVDEEDDGPGPEQPEEITLVVIPACRDAEPATEVIEVIRVDDVPLLVEQAAQAAVMQEQAALAEIEDRYAAAADAGMRAVDAAAAEVRQSFDKAEWELGVA